MIAEYKHLAEQGAKLVESVHDILEELQGVGLPRPVSSAARSTKAKRHAPKSIPPNTCPIRTSRRASSLDKPGRANALTSTQTWRMRGSWRQPSVPKIQMPLRMMETSSRPARSRARLWTS